MSKSFIVITKTHFEPEMKETVLSLAERSLPIFKEQTGLLDIYMFGSEDGSHTGTFFVWKDKASHEACMQSPDFNDMNPEWEALFSSGKARFELITYDSLW
ncbi:antibiotic biosynthesis monooxygenase [Fulvivirgaceae bacterium BMA10]|uniref:Antibiotic biosynthesis monooxygenase n=1 Tax=Splendidivirga corallicola TaxID=3051826 RepID=A0ABT8KXG4_9BACT|nr:antibiotic biosynthesis monooxygenase [Fulvivirgaceae bacterium BMA10]